MGLSPPPQDLETLAAALATEPEPDEEPDGRRRRGAQTRESILQAAADIASVEGLEGLSIGRLASELKISKSGLFAHFGSKEELQLATIDAARRRFVEHVVTPSRGMPRGRARLERLMDDWLAYYRDQVFRGGCFFHTVKAEFDSRPASPVREVVIDDMRSFIALLRREIEKSIEAGDLREDTDIAQLTFELDALGAAANGQFQLLQDLEIIEVARRAIHARLDAAAV